uniref:Uncharacterized protein n=1 Tax=Arundo donax TaxID=35708 RepID=A0A0A8Z7P3_ARUDO
MEVLQNFSNYMYMTQAMKSKIEFMLYIQMKEHQNLLIQLLLKN